MLSLIACTRRDFPSFSEGLSLRREGWGLVVQDGDISLPFRKGFH